MFSPEQIGVLIPIVALMIPIVVIMSRHQQKMAEIVRGQGSDQLRSDVEALKQEVGYLRGVVSSQTVVLENLRKRSLDQAPPTGPILADPSQGQYASPAPIPGQQTGQF